MCKRYVLFSLCIMCMQLAYSQTDTVTIETPAAKHLRLFAEKQKTATSFYLAGAGVMGIATFAATENGLRNEQPDNFPIITYAIGSTLMLFGWIKDRTSYHHLQKASRYIK